MENTYYISKHFVTAIAYGDYSGLDDNDIKELEIFLEEFTGYTFTFPNNTDDSVYTHCQITGLLSDCTLLSATYFQE